VWEALEQGGDPLDFTTPLQAALSYASLGWSVIPCHSVQGEELDCTCGLRDCGSAGKHPRTLNGFLDATTDPKKIQDWFTRWPDSNVAIVTGENSGLWVVDVEAEGLDEHAALLRALPNTIVAQTGGGGRHYYFRYPPLGSWKNRNPLLAHVDIRGEGGYVVAPPSRHRSGGQYEWDGLYAPDIHPLAPAPENLLDLARGRAGATSARRRSRTGEAAPGNANRRPTAQVEPIQAGCAWLSQTIRDAGSLSEPEWKAQADLASCLQDGRRLFHEWSAPYPDYVPAATDRKFDQAHKRGLPPTCSRIAAELAHGAACASCPHYGKIRSPIVLGMPRKQRFGERPPVARNRTEPQGENQLERRNSAAIGHRAPTVPRPGEALYLPLPGDPQTPHLPGSAGRPGGRDPQNLAEFVTGLAHDLFHDRQGEMYATVTMNGRLQTLPLGSDHFRDWALYEFTHRNGMVPGKLAVESALSLLRGRIRAQGKPAREVFSRVGVDGNHLYLNLGNPAGQFVRITAAEWTLGCQPPIPFVLRSGQAPLPIPVRDGSIQELKPFVNVASEEEFRLLVFWLLAGFRTQGPFPFLELTGGPGSGKTTLARVLLSLLDPSNSGLRSAPHQRRDFAVSTRSTWVISFDNLRQFEPWLSDSLCCLSTGSAIAYRKLYTDSEETAFTCQRPALWTGISPVASAPDLLDRTITLRLPGIQARRREAEFWSDFEAARPRILGALLDAVVGALAALPSVRLVNPPRLADFAAWSTAAEQALGWESGAFQTAYRYSRAEARATALEACPISQTLIQFLQGQEGKTWEGTAAKLLEILNERRVAAEKRTPSSGRIVSSEWPPNPRAMSSTLQRIAPMLEEAGLVCQQLPRQAERRRWRLTLHPLPQGQPDEAPAGP